MATAFISLVPISVLFFLPSIQFSRNTKVGRRGKSYQLGLSGPVLSLMLSFAAGSLFGDAFLHLLVHSLFESSPTEESARLQMMYCIVGLMIFYTMDTMVRLLSQSKDGSYYHGGEIQSQPGSPSSHLIASPTSLASSPSSICTGIVGNIQSPDAMSIQESPRNRRRIPPSPDLKMLQTGRVANISPEPQSPKSYGVHHGHCKSHGSGLLSLFADGFHNFTDGLALAVAFERGWRSGITTTMAIFLHEIPHQIGDYAVLVKAGYTHKKAIFMQLITSIAAFLGLFVGMAVNMNLFPMSDQFVLGHDKLLPLVAGGFIYVSATSILPDVLSDDAHPRTLWSSTLQVFAFGFGVYLMSLLD